MFFGKKFRIRNGDFVDSFDHFQQNRSVVEDFTSRTLAVIASDFARLYYVNSLKDQDTGEYKHDGLSNLYSESSVQAALEQCHGELFSRILETPLQDQAADLRKCLETAGDDFWAIVENWRETRDYRSMCPRGLPEYLNELFCSNMGVVLEIFSSTRSSQSNLTRAN
jgi:hypothetical protein